MQAAEAEDVAAVDAQRAVLLAVKITQGIPLTEDEKLGLPASMRSWDPLTLASAVAWDRDKLGLFGRDAVFFEFRLAEDGDSVRLDVVYRCPDEETAYSMVTTGNDTAVVLMLERGEWFVVGAVGVFRMATVAWHSSFEEAKKAQASAARARAAGASADQRAAGASARGDVHRNSQEGAAAKGSAAAPGNGDADELADELSDSSDSYWGQYDTVGGEPGEDSGGEGEDRGRGGRGGSAGVSGGSGRQRGAELSGGLQPGLEPGSAGGSSASGSPAIRSHCLRTFTDLYTLYKQLGASVDDYANEVYAIVSPIYGDEFHSHQDEFMSLQPYLLRVVQNIRVLYKMHKMDGMEVEDIKLAVHGLMYEE